jgi:serine/threonine protein kinase/WD40 repeat protein
MTGSPEPGDASEVFDFVSTFLADRAEGREQPLAAYLTRFPGHAQAIEREFARLNEATPRPEPTRRIAHYEVVRTLGSGGQGVVLLAEDTRLGRRVALKVLAPHLDFVSTERLVRFRREAEILSQLDHPGICPVYEADTDNGVPYLAMRYVEGRTLAAIVRERREAGRLPKTRAELHEIVRWIEAAARAVHEAHEHGIVHRDIKPGNLMITEGQPVLLDFGLARAESGGEAAITRSGDVLGTLAYMAPELLGKRDADRRADVYALGVTLYESIAHALPFAGETPTALWRAIVNGEATLPRSHNPAIPADLAAVIATAIARSPAHRYASAAELADDLARVRRREPIRARRLPLRVRALRWVQRHPTMSVALGAGLVLIVGLAISLERVRANERAASALNAAIQGSGTDEGAAAALADLLAAAERSPRADLRNAMLQVLDACHLGWRAPRMPPPPNRVDPAPAIDPSGRLVALGDWRGELVLRDAASGAAIAWSGGTYGPITGLAFAGTEHLAVADEAGALVLSVPDLSTVARISLPETGSAAVAVAPQGDRLAVCGGGSLIVCSTSDWRPIERVALAPPMPIRRIAYSGDGLHLAVLGKSGGDDPHGADHCWIVSGDRVARHFVSRDQEVLWIEWHPARAVLALAYNGGRVEVRAADNGTVLFEQHVGQEVNWGGFDPSGELLLIPSDHGTDLWRWSAATPTVARHLVHASERTIGCAAFDRDKRLFAAVLRDGLVLVYATADWRLLRQFRHRVRDVRFLEWLPRSGTLLTADLDDVSAWLAGVRPHAPELWGHDDAVTSVAFHRDSERVLTASRDGTARLWSLAQSAPLHVFEHGGSSIRRARLSADGDRIVTVADDVELRVWSTETGEELARLRGHEANASDAWFRGADLVSIGDDGRCIVWDLARDAPRRVLRESEAPLRCAAFDPLHPWIAVGGADRHVTVWDLDTGALVRRMDVSEHHGDWRVNPLHQVRGVVFDPQRGRLLASLVNNHLLVWSIGADWKLLRITQDWFGGPVAFDPGSGAVLCADYSFGRLSLLDGERWLPCDDLRHAHANRIAAIKIAPAGRTALSAGHDGRLLVWRLPSRGIEQAIRLPGAILDADFSPDGRWIATGSAEGAVKLWPRDPQAAARAYLARRARRLAK